MTASRTATGCTEHKSDPASSQAELSHVLPAQVAVGKAEQQGAWVQPWGWVQTSQAAPCLPPAGSLLEPASPSMALMPR